MYKHERENAGTIQTRTNSAAPQNIQKMKSKEIKRSIDPIIKQSGGISYFLLQKI